MKIVNIKVDDVRFPTSKHLDGSDAVHKFPDYSAAYVTIQTDSGLEGYGYTFSLGRGNEVIGACVQALSAHFIGKDFETEVWDNMMRRGENAGSYYSVCQDGQMRWIGPEKGVMALACGAIFNAVWDLRARIEGKPLWEWVAAMSPEQLVELIDFQHITDYITKEEALELLTTLAANKQSRIDEMKTVGFPAYTTSAGWLGYPEEKVRALCREYLAQGHRYFKMKVGSPDVKDDVIRAQAIREEIDKYPNTYLMMDANQKWSVDEAIESMQHLVKFKPLWIEEPTHCDDIMGHKAVADAMEPHGVGVATGEVCHNKVMFKQYLRMGALRYCQIDSCRVAGPSEVLAILLMAAKANIKVCPHAGGVGLCEYVRHLAMIDYCVFNPVKSVDRVCEYASHLHEHFEDPVTLVTRDGAMYYAPPTAPGYARMHVSSINEFRFPDGSEWANK
eukprot:c7477_g2_i2.p1 GENE.c7477_g2_i2~~c7477_g2_i2.p1  ORF type:complete len:447 (-),score=121.29 c7477_g2_i2:74-1414(-)